MSARASCISRTCAKDDPKLFGRLFGGQKLRRSEMSTAGIVDNDIELSGFC